MIHPQHIVNGDIDFSSLEDSSNFWSVSYAKPPNKGHYESVVRLLGLCLPHLLLNRGKLDLGKLYEKDLDALFLEFSEAIEHSTCMTAVFSWAYAVKPDLSWAK